MPALPTVRASLASFTFNYRPTALFVGGTAGVGEGTAKAFADTTRGRAHIIICGRNRAKAEEIISSFPKVPESKYEFIQCDATLMTNVVKAAEEVKAKIEGKLNFLVASQGVMTLNGFNPTSEGIDAKLAVHFYSRWKFADELLPCLEKAAAEGEDARFMTVLHPGRGAPLDVNDFGLKEKFSLPRAGGQSVTYNDLFVEEYAKRHPQVAFMHVFPGFVKTSIGRDLPWYLKSIMPVAHMLSRSLEDCGQFLCWTLIDPARRRGAFFVDQNSEPVTPKAGLATASEKDALFQHYSQEVNKA